MQMFPQSFTVQVVPYGNMHARAYSSEISTQDCLCLDISMPTFHLRKNDRAFIDKMLRDGIKAWMVERGLWRSAFRNYLLRQWRTAPMVRS